jgi:hypothetical protein
MMITRSFVPALVLLIIPVQLLAEPAESVPREREEYSVYSALIMQKFVRDDTRLIVITDPTCCDNEIPDVWRLKQLEPLSTDTFADLKEANKRVTHLKRAFVLAVPYRIVDYRQIEELFAPMMLDEEWKTFYSLYPHSNGYLRLSRVGFNKDLSEALVSTGWMRGEREGEGKYFLLSKVDGKWHVQRSVGTWIS